MALAKESGELTEADPVQLGDFGRETDARWWACNNSVAAPHIWCLTKSAVAVRIRKQTRYRTVTRRRGVDLVDVRCQLMEVGDVNCASAEQSQCAHQSSREVQSFECAGA